MKKSEYQLLQWAKGKFEEAHDRNRGFEKDAKLAFKFYANNQWDSQTLHELGDRPALTFNLVKPAVDLIVGLYDQNRYDTKAAPQDIGSDPYLCEVMNTLKDKIYEIADIRSLEDEVFEHGITCGRGFLALDVTPDPDSFPDIKINFEVVPYSEIKLDPSSRRNDYSDASYICWRKWMSIEDFKRTYPKFAKEADKFVNKNQQDEESDPSLLSEGDQGFADFPDSDEDDYTNSLYYDSVKNRIAVIHMEYYVNYQRYYGVNPSTKKVEEFQEQNLETLQNFIPNFKYVKVPDKKIKWLQFTGNTILFHGDNPLPFNDFSITPFFCYTDRSFNTIRHFGIVKPLIDPQREVNKRWSQALNLLLTQSQGGYFVEEDVPADDRQWDDTVDEPGATTFVRKNALAERRIMPKQMPQVPQAALVMEEKAQQVVNKITGINPETLQVNPAQQQSGALLRFKQLQAITILRRPFSNFAKFKKQLARKVFSIINSLMPEDQIRKILGQGGMFNVQDGMIVDQKRGVQVPLRDIKNLKYDISVVPAPDATGKKAYELSILLQMLQYRFPVDPRVLISKLDIPEGDKAAWLEFIAQQQQAASQMEQVKAQQEMQKEMSKVQLQQQKLQLKAATDAAKLQRKEQEDAMQYAIAIASLKQEDKKLVADLVTKLLALQKQTPKENKNMNLGMPPGIRGMFGDLVPGSGNG